MICAILMFYLLTYLRISSLSRYVADMIQIRVFQIMNNIEHWTRNDKNFLPSPCFLLSAFWIWTLGILCFWNRSSTGPENVLTLQSGWLITDIDGVSFYSQKIPQAIFHTSFLFRLKFGGVSFEIDPWCYTVCREKKSWANQPWNYFRKIPTYATTIRQRHRQTDRQTDRQKTYSNTALERSIAR